MFLCWDPMKKGTESHYYGKDRGKYEKNFPPKVRKVWEKCISQYFDCLSLS